MKKIARPFLAGIIDIGSHSVRLDVFEANAAGHQLLESLSRPLNLGIDVFRTGSVSIPALKELSATLDNFRKKLGEYQVKSVKIMATSALREAFNRELVISRIRHDTGMEIKILESQEEARITFLALREELSREFDFRRSSGIAFIVGTGSLIVIYFEKGLLKFCETVTVGTVRMVDELGRPSFNAEGVIETLDSAAIGQRIRECIRTDGKHKPLLIGIGAGIRLLAHRRNSDQGRNRSAALFPKEAERLAREAIEADPARLIARYGIPDHLAMSAKPCGRLIEYFLQEFNCAQFICPELTTRTALLGELKREIRQEDEDPFQADMISAAECIGEKYAFDHGHAAAVAAISLLLYDKLQRFYDFSPRSRICLELAALLHDVGRFVSVHGHHKHSYYLIRNSELPGVSASEKRIIATVARYHRKSLPTPSHAEYTALSGEEKVTVLKLAAILRAADALDRTHEPRLRKIKLKIRGDELLILTQNAAELELEKIHLELKGDLFQEVFGLRPGIEPALEEI